MRDFAGLSLATTDLLPESNNSSLPKDWSKIEATVLFFAFIFSKKIA